MIKVIWVLSIGINLLIWGCGLIRGGEETPAFAEAAWSETDSRVIAEEMARELISHPWLELFGSIHLRTPVLIVGSFESDGEKQATVDAFIKNITRALLDTGVLRLLQFRDEVSSGKSSPEMMFSKELALQAGADFILQGSININDVSIKGKKCRDYQVETRLIELKTGLAVWQGQKNVRKRIEKVGT
ncbi:MAG: hypothetical protein Q8J62_08515 [Candidatus Cloacimonadaceae bacterium]|nr:hypothetical protein [Candidatus Cloacimonadaceae bacterium]